MNNSIPRPQKAVGIYFLSKGPIPALVIFLFSILISYDAQGQWQFLGMPEHQYINQLVSLYNDSIILVAANGGFYRTTDGGNTWSIINNQVQYGDDLAFKNDSVGWTIGGNNSLSGVLTTTDAGLTWNLELQSPSFENIYYERDNNALFALSADSLGGTSSLVSLDGGVSWRDLGFDRRAGMSFSNDHHAIICSGQSIPVSGTCDSLMITNDGGFTWQSVYIPFNCWQPAFIPGTDTVIAPNLGLLSSGNYIAFSKNGGYTWDTRTYPGYNFTGTAAYCDCGNLILVQDTSTGMYLTTDNGSSLVSIGGPSNSYLTKFFYSGHYIYAGDWRGVWRYAVHHYPTITYPGPLQACSALDTSFHISFTNTCFGIPAALDTFALTGSPAFSLQPLTTPFSLANEQDIGLHYNPTPGSSDTAELYLRFNQHGDIKDTVVTFIGSGEIADHVALHLAPSIANAVAAKTFSLSIYPNEPINDMGLDTISFTLRYWNDLLNYIPNSSISAGPISVQNGEASLPITIVGTNISLDPSSPMATLNFEAMLTDTIHTTLLLADAIANPSNESYASCVLSLTSDSTPFVLDLACGDSTILAAMQNELPFSIESIVPNPAQGEITITLFGQVEPEIEMYDALGRGENVRSTSLQNGISLDVSNVPSGIYFIRLSAGGYVQSRSVVIAH